MADTSAQLGGAANNTEDKLRNQVLSGILLALQDIADAFPRITGTFTLAAAAMTVVPQTAIASNSIISLTPTNAAAAALMAGAKSLYVSARTQGASFTVATADATAAAGTETFMFSAITPV